MNNAPKRECFVIMPFGEKPDGDGTVDFDEVYKDIIKPAVESLNTEGILIKCVRCDEETKSGLIHERMIAHILDADVAVVDLTTSNPNVYYELGVRHSLRDRVTVMIRRQGSRNPFNLNGMNTIEYSIEKPDEAKQAIRSFIRTGLVSSHRDSLVYTVLPSLEVSTGRKLLPEFDVDCLMEIDGGGIYVATGDLRYVKPKQGQEPIDIWVNSENINMQMARVFDASVSALIRYLGSKRDTTGDVVEDTISDELRSLMRGRQQVNPGSVVPTGSGALLDTHRVRRVYHAATVYGTVGNGYTPIAQVEQCVSEALRIADVESAKLKEEQPFRSILFPLFGTGTARAALLDNAKRQFRAAISYLRERKGITALQRVYFLAPTKQHLEAMRLAIAEIRASEGSAPQPAAPEAAPPAKTIRTKPGGKKA